MQKIKLRDIIIAIVGLLIGLLIMVCFGSRTAKLKNGEDTVVKISKDTITVNDLYNKLKKRYATSTIIEMIDQIILNNMYELSDEDNASIQEQAQYYYQMYENYGYSKEDFLSNSGFDTEEDFLK